jgi:hypothetical protein
MIADTWAIGRRDGRISLLPLVGLALLSFVLLVALPQVPDPLVPRAEAPVRVPSPAAASAAALGHQRAMHRS